MLVLARNPARDGHHIGWRTKVPIERERYNPILIRRFCVRVTVHVLELLHLPEAIAVAYFEDRQAPKRHARLGPHGTFDDKTGEVGQARAVGAVDWAAPRELDSFGDVGHSQIRNRLRHNVFGRPRRRLAPAGKEGGGEKEGEREKSAGNDP
jgi:hypothetical protein